tara:strand:- start:389 stop:682 length:294 start_codon:yes stop_codon:yes gene_type:complete
MFREICISFNSILSHLSIEQIMHQIQQDRVCTATQCFESANAMIPMTMPSTPTGDTGKLLLMLAAILCLSLNRPRKYRAVKGDGPPPPPSPPPDLAA